MVPSARQTPTLLQKLIGRDYPNSIFLVAGPSGVGKTIFLNQMLYDRLTHNIPVIYVCVDEHPMNVALKMKMFGWGIIPYLKNRILGFVDCYSWRLGAKKYEVPEDSAYITPLQVLSSPGNLTELNIALTEARREIEYRRIALDSLTTLTLEGGIECTRKFFETLAAKAREVGGGMCTIETGVLNDHFLNYVRSAFDAVLEMKLTESDQGLKRYFRVFSHKWSPHNTRWHKFEISDEGIYFISNI